MFPTGSSQIHYWPVCHISVLGMFPTGSSQIHYWPVCHVYIYWECFLHGHRRSTIGLYATLLLLTGNEPLPYNSRPSAQVKGELHVALSQGQSDEVTLPVVRVAVVQNEAIHGLWFDDGFQLCEDQNRATKPLKLQVRVAIEMRNPHRCFCNKNMTN